MLSSPEHLLSDHSMAIFTALLNSFQETAGTLLPGNWILSGPVCFGGGRDGGECSMRGETLLLQHRVSTPLGMTGAGSWGFAIEII